MNNVHLIVVRNPFDRRIRDERMLPLDSATSVAEILAANLPLSVNLSVAIDGELITREEWESRTLKPGEQMVVMPVLHDGDTIAIVAMVAVAVVAPYAAAALNTSLGMGLAAGSIGMGLLTAGVGMVGSMIVGGLMAPQKPNLPARGLQSYDNSPAYSWSPATTQQPGGPVARAYGRHKLYGNIIAGYISNSGSTGQDQTAHLLIDLGTGPYNLLYDFKINDQPVGNYAGVTVTTRMGNVDQDIIPAFNDTRATHAIGAKVVLGTPITRATIGSDYDALEILLLCPNGLWYANDAGGMDTLSISVSVELSADGGATWRHVAVEPHTIITVAPGYWSYGYWARPADDYPTWVESGQGSSIQSDHTEGELYSGSNWMRWSWQAIPTNVATAVNNAIQLSGNTQQPIRRQISVGNLTRGTRYQVRVTNLSADQTTSRYGDDVYLAELNEVMYDDFQYPRTVLVAVDALATNQLSGSIKFSCMADAAIVRVWNGAAWSSVWSNNPAWITWDILTQPVLDNSLAVARYDGLDPSRLDLAAFYTWAQFCDTLVPDGKGGTEKRCEWDGVFDTPTSAWDAALEVCGTARAQLVIRGTTITVVVDDTRATPAQLFTVGNTSVNSFTETWLPMQDRAASIEVNYTNAEQDYARDTLTVVNTEISEATAQRSTLGQRGVTRTSQAWREANFRLKRNELLKRSAGISVDIDALACTVGDLIWVQNDVTRWGVGGRAASGSTTTKLMLDQSVTLESGKTYEVRLRLSDDTLVTRTITTAAGTVTAVDVSVAFPSAPALYDVYAIGETSKAAKEFIVLDIQRDGNQRAKLALLEYNASLYGLDSGIPALPTIDISGNIVTAGLPLPLPAVSNVRYVEVMELAAGGVIVVHLDIYFDMAEAHHVAVYESGQLVGEHASKVRRSNVTSGRDYEFSLRPFGFLGESPSAAWKSASHYVIGKLTPPLDVSGFVATRNGNSLYFNWTANAELDVAGYEIRLGASWDTAVVVGRTSRNALVTASPQGGTFLIKAYDTCTPVPNYSVTAAQCILAANDDINVVLTDDDATYGWPGTLTNMVEVGAVLNLGYAKTWNDLTQPWAAYAANWMTTSEPLQAGNYITDTHDLGAEMTCNLQVSPSLDVIALGQTWSGWTLPWSSYGNNFTWQGPIGAITATYEINTSLDGVTWTGWQPFTPGLRTLRHYKMRASFTAEPGYQIQFNHFVITVDVPDRVVRYANQSVPLAGLSLAFSPAFNAVHTVKVALLNGAAGDRFTVNNKTVNGVDIDVYDNALAAKAGTVDVEVFGY